MYSDILKVKRFKTLTASTSYENYKKKNIIWLGNAASTGYIIMLKQWNNLTCKVHCTGEQDYTDEHEKQQKTKLTETRLQRLSQNLKSRRMSR